MNTEKETPRPYIVTETFGIKHHIKGTMPVIRFGDCIDAVVVSLGAPKEQCKAKADLIVTAINEYEANRELLKRALFAFEQLQQMPQLRDEIKEALTK